MKTKLLFKDRPTGELIPLKILVLGPEGSGKKTLVEMFTESNAFLQAESYENYDPEEDNICVGCPSQELLDHAFATQQFTHVFWVDDGGNNSGETNLACDPFNMILVDNSQDLAHLFVEAQYCMQMMGLEIEEEAEYVQIE